MRKQSNKLNQIELIWLLYSPNFNLYYKLIDKTKVATEVHDFMNAISIPNSNKYHHEYPKI